MTPEETGKLIEWLHKNLPVMEQHRDTGCEIEQFNRYATPIGTWATAIPSWAPHTEYRVKPKKPRLAYDCWFAGENGFTREHSSSRPVAYEATPETTKALKEAGLIDEEYRFTSAALKAVGLIDEE